MNLINTIVDYFRSSRNELTKVTWPSRQETFRYASLVIAVSVGVAAFFGVLDMGLSKLVNASLANKTFATQPAAQEPVTPITEPANAEVQTQPNTLDFTNVTPIEAPKTGDTATPKF